MPCCHFTLVWKTTNKSQSTHYFMLPAEHNTVNTLKNHILLWNQYISLFCCFFLAISLTSSFVLTAGEMGHRAQSVCSSNVRCILTLQNCDLTRRYPIYPWVYSCNSCGNITLLNSWNPSKHWAGLYLTTQPAFLPAFWPTSLPYDEVTTLQ